MNLGLLLLQLMGIIIWLAVMAPGLILVSRFSVSVPIVKQFLTINEKWVLVKFMKALGTFCV